MKKASTEGWETSLACSNTSTWKPNESAIIVVVNSMSCMNSIMVEIVR